MVPHFKASDTENDLMFYFYKLKLEAPDLNGVVTLSLPTYNPNIITTQEKGDTKKIPSVRKVKFPVCSKE